MKVLSVGGTRPQFVKMAVLVRAFEAWNRQHGELVEHRLLHTGQHYDPLMSDIFFRELGLPDPHFSFNIQTGPPGAQTAAMLASTEAALTRWRPDAVITYGDTNSTLAGALAAAKLHIPLVHLEAGLRSHNRRMQEEVNRIVSDHISDLLLCPTPHAAQQLDAEGLGDRAAVVGDVMLDAVEHFAHAQRPSSVLSQLGLGRGEYLLATVHRAENTDNMCRLSELVRALEQIRCPVVLPLHPRLRHILGEEGQKMLSRHAHLHLISPVGYLEMLSLEQNARLILTDSGGVQKEAYFLGVPCLTMRDETEWVETLHGCWNALVGADTARILEAVDKMMSVSPEHFEPRRLDLFGDGRAGLNSVKEIVNLLEREHA